MATSSPDRNITATRREYFASQAPPARKRLKEIRDIVRTIAPGADEVFSYGVPGFKLNGKPLVWYAAFKSHMSLYPMTAAIRRAHATALKGYKMSTGTVQFPLDKPLPAPSIAPQPARRAAPQAEDQRRAHPRQPLAGAAHRRARGFQERALPRPRGHRHRGARHRRRGARPRRQLRRAARARGLHPPRRPHRARRGDRRRLHPSSRRTRKPTCGPSSRPSASACRASPFPTSINTAPRHRALRSADRRSHRRNPQAQVGGTRPRQSQRRASRGARHRRPARERRARTSGRAGPRVRPGPDPTALADPGPAAIAALRVQAGGGGWPTRRLAGPAGARGGQLRDRAGRAAARPADRPRRRRQPPTKIPQGPRAAAPAPRRNVARGVVVSYRRSHREERRCDSGYDPPRASVRWR